MMKDYQILVADDQQDSIRVLVQLITSCGKNYKVMSANTGKLACRIVEERLPDLVVLDWLMPDMDGIETLKYLKSLETTKDIPVIIVSGKKIDSEHLDTALSAGALDYIRKPINKTELKARLRSALDLSESYRRAQESLESLAVINKGLEKEVEEGAQKLFETQSLYKLLAENYPNGMVGILTKDMVYEFVSGKELEEQGLQPEDFIGKSALDLHEGNSVEIIKQEFDRVLHGEHVSFEIEFKANNYLVSATPITDSIGQIVKILSVTQNINPQKDTENHLKDSIHFIEKIVKASPSLLYILDLKKKKFLFISRNSERFLGYQSEELIGFHVEELQQLIVEKYQKRFCVFINRNRESNAGAVSEFECEFRRKDDVKVWGLVKDAVYSFDSDGLPLLSIGTISDIAELKHREEKEKQLLVKERKLNEQLEESLARLMDANKKLEERESLLQQQNAELKKINSELDNFVYRAAHDLRSPLTTTLGLLEIAREEQDINKLKYYNQLQELSLRKMDRFISHIVDISKNTRTAPVKQEIRFQTFLEIILKHILPTTDDRKIRTEVQIEQPSKFFSDQRRLYDIFTNLINNAVHYSNQYTADAWIKISIIVRDNSATIKVADNGLGISSEHIDRVFEMFYRGNEKSTGPGLGLYIVKETVHKLKGQLDVVSEIGKGSTFTIQLPSL